MFRHLLVPTDGSDLSRRTATHAITFARETGARITFFAALPQHPVSFHEGYGLTDAGTRERLIATAEQQGRAIVDPLVAEAAAAGVTAEAVATPCATVHDGIIAAATHHGCDLIFMASHGRRGIGALLLGSETQKVLTHSKIPVLVHR
ncbi:universal stress protein UspA [Zoogloea ramigera]|jgi:nucleotide-binding universal stress UspA family protein|uniref:Universal stress protein UspA n=1 Tax=Zoogloea ramigera TaxID=350 RepID=A0A4Y4CXD5_ZOORA|nr:universal stress protein [Zoogloea ramigera]GEC95687.1 universal stress protein UspA [Zoogloea ramigera]